MIISTKAGFDYWDGPYGQGGSRKYLIASLDRSLTHLGLDYVDISYSHVPDYETPFEETMKTLVDIHRQGKSTLSWHFELPNSVCQRSPEHITR